MPLLSTLLKNENGPPADKPRRAVSLAKGQGESAPTVRQAAKEKEWDRPSRIEELQEQINERHEGDEDDRTVEPQERPPEAVLQ
jgi:hypothetical protein